MRKRKQTQVIGTIISIIVLVLIIFFTNLDLSKYSYLEALSAKVSLPFKRVQTVFMKAKKDKTDYYDLIALQEENNKLKEENEELNKTQRNYEVLLEENTVLNEKLNLKNRYKMFESVPASVIGKESSNFSDHSIIDIGKNEGIEPGMAVVTESGLYGKILTVNENTSKVELIVDPASKFAVRAGNRSEDLICKGSINPKQRLTLNLLPMNYQLLKGEIVRTTKLGNVFPPGIYVGKVKEMAITKNVSDTYAIVESAVDFDKTSNVLVIKK